MKIKTKISIAIILIMILSFASYGYVRGFISHPQYMKWALFGGAYKPDYLRCFIDDEFSQGIIRGKSVEELNKWFPEMKSQHWLDDHFEKMINPNFQTHRENDVYITGVDEFAGLFIDFNKGTATKAYILKDIPNQRLDPIVKTQVDEVEAQGTQGHP